MRPLTALFCAAILSTASATASPVKSEATQQLEFGVRMALMGSWREAAFRFEKSVRIDPNNPAAHNNLGVAMESIWEFEMALAAYKRALELAPDNPRIRENLDRLQAYLETRVRPQRPPPAQASPGAEPGKPPQDGGRPRGSPGGGP